MANIQNGRCWAQVDPDEPPLIQHERIVMQAHVIGWIVAGCLALVAVAVSFWLIDRHLHWYTNKREQRYIVRILFMVPIYAVISFASYLWWNHSTALLLIRDCYESTVLTSFFYLLLAYLSPDVNGQKEIFRKVGLSREHDRQARARGEKAPHWMFPLHLVVKWKPEDGLHFFQLMKWGVLQYCVVRPVTTLAAVILNYVGLYCEDSWGPGWGHLYITVVVSISVSVAMYCLLQLYLPIAKHLAPHRPILKLFAVKAVVFLTFWQATFLSCLEDFGVIKNTQYMTADNVANGISAILETFEMMLFAFLHVRAFTYKPYYTPPDSTPRWRSLVHAMNFKETLRELWTGIVYIVRRARGRETDAQARREAVMEEVFGRSRIGIYGQAKVGVVDPEEPSAIQSASRREKSGLEDEIQRELATRGQSRRGTSRGSIGIGSHAHMFLSERTRDHPALGNYFLVGHGESDHDPPLDGHRRQRSWLRDVYSRISRSSGQEDGYQGEYRFEPHRARSGHRSKQDHAAGGLEPLLYDPQHHDYDDPPPPSVIRSYRDDRGWKDSDNGSSPWAVRQDAEPPLLSAFHLPQSSSPRPSLAVQVALPPRSAPNSTAMTQPVSPRTDANTGRTSCTPSVTTSNRSDSFLGRAFTGLPDSSSTEVTSTGPSSSQSHRTQVRLIAEPTIVTHGANTAKSPVLVEPPNPTAPPLLRPDPVVPAQGMPLQPEVGMPSEEPIRPRSSHIRDPAHYRSHILQPSLPSRPASSDARAVSSYPRADSHGSRDRVRSGANRYTPSRDHIVLPAPLAAASGTTASETAPNFPRYPSLPPVSSRSEVAFNYAHNGPESESPRRALHSPTVLDRPLNATLRALLPVSPSPAIIHASASQQHVVTDDGQVHSPVALRRAAPGNVKRHSNMRIQCRKQVRSDRRVSAPPGFVAIEERSAAQGDYEVLDQPFPANDDTTTAGIGEVNRRSRGGAVYLPPGLAVQSGDRDGTIGNSSSSDTFIVSRPGHVPGV
ncbi:hypothetical protein AcV7_000024 [Taiwanofungus camphoratus]|nr:hypothetical protein AcV7_000024 [Antrodia cinnamomea]